MHIAIFTDFHDSTNGGTQTSIHAQWHGLKALGHTVTIVSAPPIVYAPPDPDIVVVPPLPVVTMNKFPIVYPSRRNRDYILSAFAKRGKPDIIHAQTNIGIGILADRVANDLDVPFVQTMHSRDDVFAELNYPLPPVMSAFVRLMHSIYLPAADVPRLEEDSYTAHNAWMVMVSQAQAADHVVLPSHHFLDKFTRHGLTRPASVISNGILDEEVDAMPPRDPQGPDEPLRIMWVGRLAHEKRLIESIQVFEGLSGCVLDVYGDGPLHGSGIDYVKRSHLDSVVRFKGRIAQAKILAEMRQHDILLYPSFGFDNQPMVLLEAVAAGLPVVYCDPDMTECMPKGGCLISKNESPDALRVVIERLRDNPNTLDILWQAMSAGQATARQSYHSEEMVALYRRLLRDAGKEVQP